MKFPKMYKRFSYAATLDGVKKTWKYYWRFPKRKDKNKSLQKNLFGDIIENEK